MVSEPCQWRIQMSVEDTDVREDTDGLFMAKDSLDTLSLFCDQVWISVLTTLQGTKQHLRLGLGAVLTAGYRVTSLERRLILCPSSIIIVTGSTLVLVSFPIMNFWPDLQCQTLNSSRKWLVAFISFIRLLNYWVCLARLVIIVVHSGSQLGKTAGCLSSHTVYTVPLVLWKLTSMEEFSWSIPNLIPSCSIVQVCGIIANKVTRQGSRKPITYLGESISGTLITYLRVSGIPMINTSEVSILHLTIGF